MEATRIKNMNIRMQNLQIGMILRQRKVTFKMLNRLVYNHRQSLKKLNKMIDIKYYKTKETLRDH